MRRSLTTLVLCWGLLLPGCGTALEEPPSARRTPPAGSPTGSPTSTSSPTPTSSPTSTPEDPLSDLTPTGKPRGLATVTGVLADGVEHGCLLLETGEETLLLLGVAPSQARPGARVTVAGTRSPGLATRCQQGIPFVVRDLRPAR